VTARFTTVDVAVPQASEQFRKNFINLISVNYNDIITNIDYKYKVYSQEFSHFIQSGCKTMIFDIMLNVALHVNRILTHIVKYRGSLLRAV